MKVHQFLLLCIFALSPLRAFAIQYVGNGGNIVQCTAAEGKTTYEVLDSFESRSLRKKPLILTQGNPKDLAIEAISGLKSISPERAKLYLKSIENFDSESELTDAKLTSLEDSKYAGIPPHCQVEQAVIQQDFATPGSKRYFIQKALWQKLDSSQKAVLILHEIIYREALSIGQTDSIATRAFVGLLISGEIRKLSVPEFAQTLFGLGFDTLDAQGLKLRLFEMRNGIKVPSMPVFNSRGQLLSADLVDIGELQLPNLNPAAAVRGKLKPNPAHVEFWEDTPGAPRHIQTHEDLDLVGVPPTLKSHEIWTDRDGLLAGVEVDAPFRLSLETYFLNFGPGKLVYERGFLTASYAPLRDGWIEVGGKPVYLSPNSRQTGSPVFRILTVGPDYLRCRPISDRIQLSRASAIPLSIEAPRKRHAR